MRILISLIFISFFTISDICAQFNYHRIYPVSGRSELGSSIRSNSSGYVTLNTVMDNNFQAIALNVTQFDPKGEASWTRDITYGDKLPFNLVESAELEVMDDNSIYITTVLANESMMDHNKVITKLSAEGIIEWSKAVGGFENVDADTVAVAIAKRFDNTICHFSNYFGQAELGINAINFDEDGNTVWSQNITASDSFGLPVFPVIQDATQMADSLFILGGQINDLININAMLMKVDTSGNPLWAKSYLDSLGGFNLGLDIASFEDSTTVQVGVNLLPGGGFFTFTGFVMAYDYDGNLLWSKQATRGAFPVFTLLNGVAEATNGDILISGEFLDALSGAGSPFIIRLDKSGNVIWQKDYPRASVALSTIGELVSIEDSGMAYYTSSTQDFVTTYAQLIVADSLGAAMCEDSVLAEILVDVPTGEIGVFVASVADTAIIDIETNNRPRQIGFDIPSVTLIDSAFCPGVPIMVIEDAMISGDSVTYLWNTEETTPMITVEEESTPIVEVTINDERGCYTICDTATISVLDSTMVSIQADYSPYCETRTVNLIATVSGGRAPYDITWSDSNMGPINPNVAVPGQYSVTAIDQCMIPANAGITVEDLEPATAVLQWNLDRYCAEGVIELQINNATSPLSEIKWFDGAGNELPFTNLNPIVSEFGTYSFTALDSCNFVVADQITVPDNLPPPREITIDFNWDLYCAQGLYELQINGPVGPLLSDIRWMDAQGNLLGTSLSQIVDGFGQYSVVAFDDCQNEISDDIIISLDDAPTINLQIMAEDTINCETGLLRLFIENTSGLTNIEWSSGETNVGEIFVNDFDANYIVSADFCQMRYTSDALSPNLNSDNLVSWPNAFAPRIEVNEGTPSEFNRLFGPYVNCPDAISEYELKVYSQFGNLIFESEDPTEFWDGTKDGDNAPSDTYVWYSAFTVAGVNQTTNGTVNLIR